MLSVSVQFRVSVSDFRACLDDFKTQCCWQDGTHM